jgi:hypothetical protein
MDNQQLIPIGKVGVDTGRLLIIDPAHLDSDETRTLLQQLDRETLLEAAAPARQLHFSRGHAGLGVVLMSGWGDGTYTVMADTFVDDHGFTIISEIRIQFTDPPSAPPR